MVETKNQIRPRRKKFHFSNAEILALDTTGLVVLVGPAPLGCALAMNQIQIRTNIVQLYTGDDAAAFFGLVDDFGNATFVENDASGVTAFSDIFANYTGLNLLNFAAPELVVDSNDVAVPGFDFTWTDEADLAANGGIYMYFTNGGTDLGGGDPLNYLDIFVSYDIVNL